MKAKEIAVKYGFKQDDFEQYLIRQDQVKTTGFMGTSVADADVPRIVELYEAYLDEKEAKRQQAQREKEEKELAERKKQQAIARMLVSSGFNFDGYRIVRYSGYISGDDAIQINRGDLFINAGQNLTDALVVIRTQALKELKEAAYDLGCNAVIGVDFDYLTFEPETANASGGTTYQPYVVCVTANGNAVVIEKED